MHHQFIMCIGSHTLCTFKYYFFSDLFQLSLSLFLYNYLAFLRLDIMKIDNLINNFTILLVILLYIKHTVHAQGINFDKYPGSKWPGGVVPYYLSNDDFDSSQKVSLKIYIWIVYSSVCAARLFAYLFGSWVLF
jgi:hypothetical protein